MGASRRTCVFSMFLALIALATACRRETPAEALPAGATVGVSTAVATAETLRDAIVAEGQVVPALDADFSVTAPEPALLAELPKALGDAVAVGDVLARFDIPAITELIMNREREFSEATVRLQSARSQAERHESLFASGVIARNLLEASRAAIDPAQRAVADAKAQLDAARQTQDRAIVKAKFAGVVARKFHEVGDFVAGGPADPVLRVVDPARVEVSVLMPANQAVRIVAGLPATIQTAGVIETLAATVGPRALLTQPGASTTEVRLSFKVPSKLAVDTAVRAEIVFAERPDTIVIPSVAIQRDDTSAYVMVAAPDSHARRRTVRVGLVAGERSEILEGLSPGERIIVKPLDQVSDGVAITVER